MEEIDLFEHYELIPKELSDIIDKYSDFDDLDYINIEKILKEVENIGYTFEYGLDGIPFNLHKKD